MDEIKEKKSRRSLQIIGKVIILIFFLSFVFKIKNFHQAIVWISAILFYVLFFFGKRAKAFWEQPWRFRTVEDFLWAIIAILGVAYLIIRAFV
jgi:ABC-type iron transport system FetAB permease component